MKDIHEHILKTHIPKHETRTHTIRADTSDSRGWLKDAPTRPKCDASLTLTLMLIRNREGELIAHSWVPGAPGSRELVVIGHGVTSDKERPWSEYLSQRLAARGVASMRIAWSGNGDSEGDFEDSTISKEVADLGAILDALEDRWRVSFVGHSMGASVGMRRATGDPRIAHLVCLAGMVHTKDFMDSYFGDLSVGDFILGKPDCPLSAKLVKDLHEIGSVIGDAAQIEVPWLIVHGTADGVVPIAHSRDAHAASQGHAELVEIAGVDHSFTGDGLQKMADIVVPWLCDSRPPNSETA